MSNRPASEFHSGLSDICATLTEIASGMRALELALASQHKILQNPSATAWLWEQSRPVILNSVGELMHVCGETRSRLESSISKLENLAAGN